MEDKQNVPDCDHPKCHEQMVTELNKRATWEQHDNLKNEQGRLREAMDKRMPKSWLWLGVVFVGLPSLGIGAGLWAEQASDQLRFAAKADLARVETRVDRLETSDQYIRRDLADIKSSVNQMLNMMQKEWKRSLQ